MSPAVLDSHVHFWNPGRLSYPWLGEVPALNRPLTPDSLEKDLAEPVEAIFVEAGRAEHQALTEIRWVRRIAERHPWIRGAVAHVPVEDEKRARALIRRCATDPFVVGVRRNLQDEADGFTADPSVRAAMRQLGEAGLPFDACVRSHQLAELDELVLACPQTTFVLDHLGKPPVGGADDEPWRNAIHRLAHRPNVVCKLSGLATEAAPGTPPAKVLPYLREALAAFGPDRCMYGSDWPVMTLATGYRTWLDLVREALATHSQADMDAVLRGNAARVYRVRPERPSRTGTVRKDTA